MQNRKIRISLAFREKFYLQVRYIAKDKPAAARNFKNVVFSEIRSIPKMPYSYRKSIFFKDESIRDLIYKGYVITFRITNASIEIFGFNKYEDA